MASLTDEELERAIHLFAAPLDSRTLTPSEAAEVVHFQASIDVPPSPLSDSELVAKVDRDLKAFRRLGLVAAPE